MLSSGLRSKRAIQVNIAIMRTFVTLRQMLAIHKDLVRNVTEDYAEGDNEFTGKIEKVTELK